MNIKMQKLKLPKLLRNNPKKFKKKYQKFKINYLKKRNQKF